MNIAERIDQLMETKNITRGRLAKESGVPYTTLDGIKKRNCDNVKLSTLIKLADYFEISLDYLVGRGDDSELSFHELEELKAYRKYLEWRKRDGET